MSRGLSAQGNERVERLLTEAEQRGAAAVAPDEPTRKLLLRRVRRGEIVTPMRGLYLRRTRWERIERNAPERTMTLARGLSRLHPNWVFCRETAACAHGLRVSHHLLDALRVVGEPSARSDSGRVAWHRVRCPEDTVAGGLRVTSLRVTALDFLRTQEPREGLVVADAAAARLGLSGDGLARCLASVGKGLPGVGRALRVARYADARSESGGESLARAMMIKLGYVVPELQVWVANPLDGRRPFRVDGLWLLPDGTPVIFELDGHEKRVNPEMTHGASVESVLEAERQRESLMSAYGARILRLSYRDAINEAEMKRRLDAYGVPKLHDWAGREMVRPDSAMRGGRPAPNGAVIRNGWLVYAAR